MMQPFRRGSGGAIDRGAPVAFTFNGRRYSGYRGDTLASALLANGVHLVARSFKYHRRRGIFSAGPEEPCALVRVGDGARVRPNLPATLVELVPGLAAHSINCWPAVGNDFGEINDLMSAVLPAGFYYKTFMWPGGAWKTYEYFIRRAAGIGRTPEGPDPDRYEKRFDHCDVLVIGGGPAGLAAARAAAEAGARVLLAESAPGIGGQLRFREEAAEDLTPDAWLRAQENALLALPEARILTRTTATGYYDHNLVTLVERMTDHDVRAQPHRPRERLWKVRARHVVLATGAHERHIAFGNNDLPGVMLAAAAQRYVSEYAVLPGRCAVVFTNNASGYAAALALAQSGVDIAAVVDSRQDPQEAASARARGVRVVPGHVVVTARGTNRVTGARLAPVDATATRITGPSCDLACDVLCVSGGWDPAVHLWSQSGSTLAFDEAQHCFVPGAAAQPLRAAGAANGAFWIDDCIAQGRAAGQSAARAAGFGAVAGDPGASKPLAIAPLWQVPDAAQRTKQFVDLQHDVTTRDLLLAVREGYTEVEHAKRYTTTGMGLDQGKTGNVVAYGVLGAATGRRIPEVGTTTFRPPYTPVTIGALAGREVGERFDPWRRTPMTDWHAANGAVLEPVGLWRRPMYYAPGSEAMHAAVARECLAVRNGVGILDASTLGKIEVRGPDAARFLNRVYTNRWDNLAVGRCRYGLMLREDGMVFDDGVTTRLGEQHFLMTTTSGGADAVAAWLEDWLQCEWRDLRVFLAPVTANWATICLTGPHTRAVLARAGASIDFSTAAFPHMSVREGLVCGVRARACRVSFTGEYSMEINVLARHGRAVWERLLAAGAAFGITPFGTEALHVLRAEKGYIVVGHETDGTVNPLDLGMQRLLAMGKGDFLGKRGLARADNARAGRKQLVGLMTVDPQVVVPEGSQIVTAQDAVRANAPPVPMLGHVTSSYASPVLKRSIALALVADGLRRMNETVTVLARGNAVAARIVAPCCYDPQGARLNG